MFSPAWLTVALLSLSSAAGSTPRLALAPVRGDAGGEVGAQLAGALCGAHRCIQGVLASGAGPELARARRLGATGSLVGSIWREPDGRVLSLALFTAGARPLRSWVLPLEAGGLVAPARLERLAAELADALGDAPRSSGRPPGPPRPALETRPIEPAPVPSSAPAPRPPAPSRPEVLSLGTPPRLPPPGRVTAGPWGGVEVGVEPARQTLRFPSGGTAPVGYAVDLPAAPRLRLELHPLRNARTRAAGLALFAEATYLPGIALPAGARTFRATSSRLRGGLLWQLTLWNRLVVAPAVAYERESFVVRAAGGLRLPGLPDTRLAGVSAALGLELPLGGPRLRLLAGGRSSWWFDAGELAGGASFFPGGHASTLEAEAGAAVVLSGPLSLRVLGHYAVTRWHLDLDPSGAFTARTARADRWGGRLSLRLEF